MRQGLFQAALLSPGIQSIPTDHLRSVRQDMMAGEGVLAFSLLTAIIMKHDYKLSVDLWAIIEHLGEEMGVEPKQWHGLKEKMDSR